MPGAWVPSQFREPRSHKLHSDQDKKIKKVQVGEPGVEPGSVAASAVNGGDQTLSFCVWGGAQGEEETGRGRDWGHPV